MGDRLVKEKKRKREVVGGGREVDRQTGRDRMREKEIKKDKILVYNFIIF